MRYSVARYVVVDHRPSKIRHFEVDCLCVGQQIECTAKNALCATVSQPSAFKSTQNSLVDIEDH